MKLLSNAQAALLSGYEKQFHMEPDTDAIIDAINELATVPGLGAPTPAPAAGATTTGSQ